MPAFRKRPVTIEAERANRLEAVLAKIVADHEPTTDPYWNEAKAVLTSSGERVDA